MNKNNLLFSYLLFSLVFCIFQANGVIENLTLFLSKSHNSEISSFISVNEILNSSVIIYLAQFLLVSVIISAVFIWCNARFAIFFSKLPLTLEYLNNEKLAILAWALISNSTLLILNSAYFQHSSHLAQSFRVWPEHHLSTLICWAIFFIPFIFIAFQKEVKFKAKVIFIITPILVLCIDKFQHEPISIDSDLKQAKQDKPNIILIGIDSLRSDLLKSHMPFLYSQLTQSIIFDNSYTELGRTFPAWNTILTGKYPINHGARINLLPSTNLTPTENYLPNQLKEHGYKTIFAYDETRFANIGTHQGIDNIISPRMGASDFIIGLIADYPLINLLSLWSPSRILIPEIYANRAIHTTYRADSFSHLINTQLPIADQATFLAVHFCLAHWPYKFSTRYPADFSYRQPYYPSNLQAVDDQIRELMTSLESKGYLENSRIIFLSDHGEAWEGENPVFTSIKEQRAFTRRIAGHGSDLVTDNANRILLAFKDFPNPQALYENTYKLASLADISPTILASLGLPHKSTDGLNLSNPKLPQDRWLPIETGTVFDAKDVTADNVVTVISPLLERYTINQSGLVEIKADKIEDAIAQKRIGIRNNSHVITLEDDGYYIFNTTDNTFESYPDLKAFKDNRLEYLMAWCRWHDKNDENCK